MKSSPGTRSSTGPLLLISTAGPEAFTSLARPDAPTTRRALGARSRGRDLVPAIQSLLADAGLAMADLDGLVVDRGPGSFTGVRVGVTTAKTLAFARDLPIVGATSHLLLAAPLDPGPCLVLRDAGRGRVYAQCLAGGSLATDELPIWCPLEDALAMAPEATVVAEADSPLAEGLDPLSRAVRYTTVTEDALEAVGRAALAAGSLPPAHRLVPAYVQKSTPEQVREGLRPA